MMSAVAHYGITYSRDRKPEFFTSNLYPWVIDDVLYTSHPVINRGTLFPVLDESFESRHAHITTGYLTEVIRYPFYQTEPEVVQNFNAQVLSGYLNVVIAYKFYDYSYEKVGQVMCSQVRSGYLNTVVNYINYTNVIPDNVATGLPGIVSGILANG